MVAFSSQRPSAVNLRTKTVTCKTGHCAIKRPGPEETGTERDCPAGPAAVTCRFLWRACSGNFCNSTSLKSGWLCVQCVQHSYQTSERAQIQMKLDLWRMVVARARSIPSWNNISSVWLQLCYNMLTSLLYVSWEYKINIPSLTPVQYAPFFFSRIFLPYKIKKLKAA